MHFLIIYDDQDIQKLQWVELYSKVHVHQIERYTRMAE